MHSLKIKSDKKQLRAQKKRERNAEAIKIAAQIQCQNYASNKIKIKNNMNKKKSNRVCVRVWREKK